MPTNDLPTVYAGIPTGYIKEYAILYMLGSLRNVDYPADKLKVTFAVTDLHDFKSTVFLQRVKNLVHNANMPFETSIFKTDISKIEFERYKQYSAVIKNVHELRLRFLEDKRWSYIWLMGGDNPPARDVLKRLVALNCDVASARLKQRPLKSYSGEIHDLVWDRHWHVKHIPYDLEPQLRYELRRAWKETAFLKPADLKGKKIMRNVLFGSGCSLVRREVMEHIGYMLGWAGNHSEDLHFCQWATLLNYKTAVDLEARCLHFDPDGTLY